MNILYCGDDHMKRGLLLSILSLLDQVPATLNIYVLTAKVTPQTVPLAPTTIAYLNDLVQQRRSTNQVQLIDITDLVQQTPPTANFQTIFTPSCMLRLYADQVTALPDKLLYLDTDVLCRQDCRDFYDQSLAGADLAGILDHYGQWLFHQHGWHRDYLNSGILLLNLKRIRQTGLFTKCRQCCQTKQMFMPDQSALNKLAQHKVIWPRRYNEQRRLHADTVFQHFTTSFRMLPWVHILTVKPWEVEAMHHKLKLHAYDQLLAEYQALALKL
ncbi:glycosyltransferase [Lactiplantibacillus daowaiensis]|uniref:Glycosyltransferase n=1 Tax=Lactiplantibacillus daowaiensis TaxID=2559918 RepID=A0ABW1S1B5_9LACO|nr:glycosyltransferase [Lactiplantibacillus daowaiensis]